MKNQDGRSMIEMLGVLAIVGVLSVGGIAGYSKAMEKMKINKQIQQIVTVAANIQTLFINQNQNYNDLNERDSIIHSMHIIPEEYWNGQYFNNVYGSQFQLMGNDGWFMIYLSDVPDNLCVPLLSYDWKSIGVKMIESDTNSTIYLLTNQLTMDDIIKMCQYNTGDGTMGEIEFFFGDNVPYDEEWSLENVLKNY